MKKLIYGVGINDADYPIAKNVSLGYVNGKQIQKRIWTCPYYRKWHSMLKRCFCPKTKISDKSYESATCCKEWLIFSNFKKWMEQQEWEGKHLDKDLLLSGNSTYSPELCCFLPVNINVFIIDGESKYKSGAQYKPKKGKYGAWCKNQITKKNQFLGYFSTISEAHEAWRDCKEGIAIQLSRDISDVRIANALKKRYSKEDWYGAFDIT